MLTRSPIQKKLVQCCLCRVGDLRPAWKGERNEEGEKVYYCKSHAMMRTAQKQIKEGKASKQVYDDFCRHLWKTRPHVSDISGSPLPEYDEHSPRFCNLIRFHMHHVKPEGQELKSKKALGITLDADKIIFVTKYEHEIIEWGSPKQKGEIGWNDFSLTQK